MFLCPNQQPRRAFSRIHFCTTSRLTMAIWSSWTPSTRVRRGLLAGTRWTGNDLISQCQWHLPDSSVTIQFSARYHDTQQASSHCWIGARAHPRKHARPTRSSQMRKNSHARADSTRGTTTYRRHEGSYGGNWDLQPLWRLCTATPSPASPSPALCPHTERFIQSNVCGGLSRGAAGPCGKAGVECGS